MQNIESNSTHSKSIPKSAVNRRQFLRNSAMGLAAGSSLQITPVLFGTNESKLEEDLNIALIGLGRQGYIHYLNCLKIPHIRICALCDIWENYRLPAMLRRIKRRSDYQEQDVRGYVDYQEMLDKEVDLDAVVIATPDFYHAQQAVKCMEAGLHVYCEAEMSNTIDGAQKMVSAARTTGKLLQIGRHRRSYPHYRFCYEKIVKELNLFDRFFAVNGQGNYPIGSYDLYPIKKRLELEQDILEEYGYESMKQLCNWRWYKHLGGGPVVGFGSHQIDVYRWFLGNHPKSIIASGGNHFQDDKQWYDNVMVIYEFETRKGIVRSFYQTIPTNSNQGYSEFFIGKDVHMSISDSSRSNAIYISSLTEEEKLRKGLDENYLVQINPRPSMKAPDVPVISVPTKKEFKVYIKPSPSRPFVPWYKINLPLNSPPHQPHLENFFNTIRGKEKLNCPADEAYATTVAVLKINEAVAAGRTLEFKPEEFVV